MNLPNATGGMRHIVVASDDLTQEADLAGDASVVSLAMQDLELLDMENVELSHGLGSETEVPYSVLHEAGLESADIVALENMAFAEETVGCNFYRGRLAVDMPLSQDQRLC